MDDKNLLVSLIFFAWGGISIVSPTTILRFRAWLSKKVYDADYKFSQKTIKIQRFLGVLFIIIGLFFVF